MAANMIQLYTQAEFYPNNPWPLVKVTDYTKSEGLHYDVMIDVTGEDYWHLMGSSEIVSASGMSGWNFWLKSGDGMMLEIQPWSATFGFSFFDRAVYASAGD